MKGRLTMVEFNLSVNQNAQPIEGANVVENTSPPTTQLETGLKAKLHTGDQVKKRQESTPLIKADVAKFVKIACGLALIGTGVLALGVLSPIVLPLGLLGAAASFTAAKAKLQGQPKNVENTQILDGATVIGASIGTLGCGALVLAGILLIRGETKKSEAPATAKVGVENQQPKESNQTEKGFQSEVNTLLNKLYTKANLKDEQGNLIQDSSGKFLSFDEGMFKKEAVDIKNKLIEASEKNEISKEVGQILLFKLSYNENECALQCKIDSGRNRLKNGSTPYEEIKTKYANLKEQLSDSYKDNSISKDFYKSSLKEIKEFKNDYKIGQKNLQQDIESAIKNSPNLLGPQVKFGNFTEEIRKIIPNSNLEGKSLINGIKQDTLDIKNTMSNQDLDLRVKLDIIASKSGGGSGRIEGLAKMVKTLEKTILEANGIGKEEAGELREITEKRNEIKSSIETLKRELNTDGLVFPTQQEVADAYNTLRKYAQGTVISEDVPIATQNEAVASRPEVDQEANWAELENILGEEIVKNTNGAAETATNKAVEQEIDRLNTELNEGIDDETFAKLAEYAPKTEISTAKKTEASTLKNDPAAALFDEIDRMTGAKLDEVFDNLPKVEPETAPKAAPKTETTTVKKDPAADLFAEMEDMIKTARRNPPGNIIKG